MRGGNIYSIEGTSVVDAFDFDTMTWDTTVAPLNTPRAYAAAVAFDGYIYVMGGVDDSGRVLNTVEVYDSSRNEWYYTSSMLRHREGSAAVVYGDSILVFGGAGFKEGTIILHRFVETYSVATGIWTTDSNMTLGRIFHHAVKIGPAVYIFGGFGGSIGPLGVVEKYVPGDSVSQVRFLWKYPRGLFDIVQMQDSILVISGFGQGSVMFQSEYASDAQGYFLDIDSLTFVVMTAI